MNDNLHNDNDQQMLVSKTKLFVTPWLIATLALVCAAALLTSCRRKEPPVADVAEPGFDLDAYLAATGKVDVEKGFDMEAHIEALNKVGEPHLAAVQAMTAAHAARTARERELTAADTPGAEINTALGDLRGRIAIIRAAVANEDGSAGELSPEAAAEEAALLSDLEAKTAELQALYEDDAEWCKLNATFDKTNTERAEAAKVLHAVIRARMKAQYALFLMTNVTEEVDADVTPSLAAEAISEASAVDESDPEIVTTTDSAAVSSVNEATKEQEEQP
ncbi:MAG: hypothetical protein GX230_02775 [Lentisphaerae bacterium]|jgi:hypothetical protein|nr:hypothetical protein [Lentisphaerota bacterium]